ncbi:MAG: hypothetical protein K8L99_02250 [Anaerolineae bacterium]|nr:hypothetical protein [Anaerolineae bacterium]
MYVDKDYCEVDELSTCPICHKLFLQEKKLYLHIMHVHPHSQQFAFDLQADMYKRWQDRLPRAQH